MGTKSTRRGFDQHLTPKYNTGIINSWENRAALLHLQVVVERSNFHVAIVSVHQAVADFSDIGQTTLLARGSQQQTSEMKHLDFP